MVGQCLEEGWSLLNHVTALGVEEGRGKHTHNHQYSGFKAIQDDERKELAKLVIFVLEAYD